MPRPLAAVLPLLLTLVHQLPVALADGPVAPPAPAIRHSDVVFMVDDPTKYQAYGCTVVVGWGERPEPERVKAAHAQGVRLYSGSVGFVTESTQVIDFSPEFLDADCRNFAGQVQDAGNLLIQKLESRLDNVVYRLGFAASRSQAKQMTTHGHFLVNGKKVDVPSCQIKKGDVVSLRPSSKAKPLFANITAILKKSTPPLWLKLDPAKLEGKVIGEPNLEEVSPPAEISSIFEFYSR